MRMLPPVGLNMRILAFEAVYREAEGEKQDDWRMCV